MGYVKKNLEKYPDLFRAFEIMHCEKHGDYVVSIISSNLVCPVCQSKQYLDHQIALDRDKLNSIIGELNL